MLEVARQQRLIFVVILVRRQVELLVTMATVVEEELVARTNAIDKPTYGVYELLFGRCAIWHVVSKLEYVPHLIAEGRDEDASHRVGVVDATLEVRRGANVIDAHRQSFAARARIHNRHSWCSWCTWRDLRSLRSWRSLRRSSIWGIWHPPVRLVCDNNPLYTPNTIKWLHITPLPQPGCRCWTSSASTAQQGLHPRKSQVQVRVRGLLRLQLRSPPFLLLVVQEGGQALKALCQPVPSTEAVCAACSPREGIGELLSRLKDTQGDEHGEEVEDRT
mmetsp:Transcript_82687/g.177169  ORF Transcript_82687/g.177169 Transcript_82687/m.177169 type:complete len:276 (-) Transcript_82687:130-957(-)